MTARSCAPLSSGGSARGGRSAAGYGNAEARRLIQSVLDRLPARYGDVLEWKYIEGRSVEEIGELLGIGAGSGPIGAGAQPLPHSGALETVFGSTAQDILGTLRGK
jgi:RNA polymerase sigma-70 factor (ECF subfamily)